VCQYADVDIHVSTRGYTHNNIVCHISKSLTLFGDEDYIYSFLKFDDQTMSKFGI